MLRAHHTTWVESQHVHAGVLLEIEVRERRVAPEGI